MAQTTSLVFNGGVIPSPTPGTSGSGKAKLLKIGEITVTKQGVQVTKKVICDPDSITTVAPFMEVLTSAKLAELISANSILVLDDGTVQYLMADATVVVEDGTAVCTSVSFLGLSLEDRAKVLYPCTRIADELTLHQVLEVGEPVETGFDLVKAYPEDTEAGTLIDKFMVEDTVQGPDDQSLLEVVQGDGKVAINEDNLRRNIDDIYNSIDSIVDTIDEIDFNSVPRTYLHSSLNQSAGDSVTTRTTIDTFAVDALESECFEFEETTTIDDVPFGYVWIEPGTYLINASVTLQWVGNPRGTFIAKVGSVMGENFDFSQEQEISRQSTKVVTIPNRMKLVFNVTYDAGTPLMGFWIQSVQVVKLAGGMSQTTVAHGLSLVGNGSVENPLDISEHGLREAFDYAKDEEYFATKQEVAPLATQEALQAETARATQRENEIEALFTLPTQEAVDSWLDAHPEATTTVQDHSLTGEKFTSDLALKTIKDYVTPEMFGAVGDGVTDDTAAFTAMVASSSKYLLTKTYAVSGVIIDKTFVMIGTPGNSLVALSNSQEFILQLDSGRKNYIAGVNFDGKGGLTSDTRGNVVGVLLNSSSTSEFLMERCSITCCKTGFFAPKTFWHSELRLCRFNSCGTGISIGYVSSPATQSYLELLFSQIYCNQCDLHVYLEFGTLITFNNCSFGSESILEGSKFLTNRYPISRLVFESCNFEGIFIKNNNGAFDLESTISCVFNQCYFHIVDPAQDVSPSNVSLFYCRMAIDSSLEFIKCRFANISVAYIFDCHTGAKKIFTMDYDTMKSIAASFPYKFSAKNVYSNSTHIFHISNIPTLSEIPSNNLWDSNLNAFFRGVTVHINKTTDFYMWNGTSWIKMIYVPQPASDENTYTLKNVAGTLTWVQDA